MQAGIATQAAGSITRAALAEWTNRGPGAALQHLALQIRRDERGGLMGYEVAQISALMREATDALHLGDVLFGLQGELIHSPEDLMAVWRLLPNAEQVRVAIYRGAAPLELVFEITEL